MRGVLKMQPMIWIVGSLVVLAGVILAVMSHVMGNPSLALLVPILWGAGVGMYLIAMGLREPIAIVLISTATAIVFMGILVWGWFGLGGML